MRIDVLTLFPEMFTAALNTSIIGRALENELVVLNYYNIRDFSEDKHRRVDDYPYGGGLGMVMQCEPIVKGVDFIKSKTSTKPHVIMMSPYGKTFDQEKANELKKYDNLIFICGHYEGIDYRVNELVVDEEISIGDFILTGGEIPAMAMIDSIVRLLPGVLKLDESHGIESFSNNLLEYPQYTRPPVFMGRAVPEILFSGHHENIRKWRQFHSLRLTYIKRRELLEKATLTKEDKKFLKDIENEIEN